MNEKTIDASVKVVLFRHPFKSERDIFYAQPAVISSYCPDLSPHLALVAIRNDEKVTPEDMARAGDTIILRVVPAGGMSTDDQESAGLGAVKVAGGAALLAVASVLAAPLVLTAGVTVAAGMLGFAGLALISTGAYRIISALYQGTTQEDSVDGKGIQRPDIRGSSNQSNPDGKLPIIFGKHKIFPLYATTPYTSIETPSGGDVKNNAGQDLFLNLLFAVGYAPLKISEVKIGEVTVASAELSSDGDLVNTGPYSGITGRFTNGSIPASFQYVVKEEQVNITLEGSEYAASTSALSITVTAASLYFDAPVGTDLNALGFKPGVMATFAGFTNAGNNGAFIVMNVTQVGGTGTNRRLILADETTGLADETSSVSFFVTPVNMVTTPKNTEEITVQLTFPQGLAKYDSKGVAVHDGIVVRAYYRAKGTLSWTLMPYFVGASWSLTGFAAEQTIRLSSTVTPPTAGEYEVRVAREQGPWKQAGYTFYDTVVWSALQSKTGVSVCADPTKVAFLYLKVKATTALSGNLAKISLIAESTYTESVTGASWTEDAAYRYSPASAFLWALTGPANPRPVPLADLATYIDYATLVQWRDYCAATVSGAQFHTCNAVVTEGTSLQQLLTLICSTGRGFFYMKDGKYSVGWDAATTTVVQLLTPRNSWGFQWTKQFDEIPQLLKIPFIDATNDWASDERLVYLDGGSETSEPKESISSWGITSPDEIMREGRYVLKCRALRPEAYTGFMDAEQLACTLGDRIEVAHDGLLVGGQWGRIISVSLDGSSQPTAIVVDEPCTMVTGTNYQVRIRNAAGAVLSDVVTVEGENYTLTFSTPLTAGSIESDNLFQFGAENLVTIPAIVVGIEMQEDLSAKLSLIPYNASVFDEDSITPPVFESLISKAPVFLPRAVGSEVDRVSLTTDSPAANRGVQVAASADATSKASAAQGAAEDYADGLATDLQSQIDGNISSWFYAAVPTLINAPASSWTDDATKNNHLGDLYYDTSTGYAYRFAIVSTVYQWMKITDSDVTEALALAAAAQATADAKRRCFTTTPTTPYDVGDLWAEGSTGDIKRCTTARSSGAYVAGDWTLASKYTDDTAADAAQTTADNAATAASSAQTSANTANSAIADIASDDKFTAVEKSSSRLEWNTIAAELSVNDAQATAFGITTEKTTYDAAFQALATYLNAGVTWSSGVPSWIADANLAVTTTFVGATFRSTWKAYYDARTALLNAISAKAKTLADTAQVTATAKSKTFIQAAAPTTGMATGDYWLDSDDGYKPYVYYGSAWVVDAAMAQAIDAYGLADGKNTTWATLAAAQASGVTGDLFIDSSLLYRCTVDGASITLANSVRLTPKSWGKLASAPSSGMIANDSYYNTTTGVSYYYSGSAWTSVTDSLVSYSVAPSVGAITKNRTGALSTSPVVFSLFSRLANVSTAYSGRVKIYEDGTLKYTSSANETSKSYAPTAGISTLLCEMYAAGGVTILLDSISMSIAYDASTAPMYLGQFAYSAFPTTSIIIGDWVLCNETGGAYTKGLVYEYTGSAWTSTTASDKLNRAMSDLLSLAATDTSGPAVVFAQSIIAMNATILALQARVLYIQNLLYGGGRFDEDGDVIDETGDGFYLPASGAFLFEGPDLSITKDRIRLYKGAGVQRRCLEVSDEAISLYDTPDGGAELLRGRIGRLGVGPSILMDGEFNAAMIPFWGSESTINSADSYFPSYIQTSDGVLRVAYRNNYGYLVERVQTAGVWGAESAINVAASREPSYVQTIDGVLRVAYRRDSDGYLVERVQTAGVWGAESVIHEADSYFPSYIQTSDGVLRVAYCRDSDGYLVERVQTAGVWGAESVIHAGYSSVPSYIQTSDGVLRIAYQESVDFVSYLVERVQTAGVWGAESVIATTVTITCYPAYVQTIDGVLRVAYRNNYGYLVERVQTAGVWGEESIINAADPATNPTPSYIQTSDGVLRIAYRQDDTGYLVERTLQRYAQIGAGIIEHGSNADGVYDKYSSGKLVCTIPPRTLTHGTSYDWPYDFVATPDYANFTFIDASASVVVGVHTLTATTYAPHIGGGGSTTLTGIAIGRWK